MLRVPLLRQFIQWLNETSPQPLVRSYLFLRKGIGIIGVALPFVLLIGEILLESHRIYFLDSISAYYYSVMRNVFVGSLCAIGVFLICYQYQHLDDIVSTVAGICAIGVALFPTTPPDVGATQLQVTIGLAHLSFATCFFLILASMAIFLFTRTDQKKKGRRKQLRNAVYYACGIAIVVFLVLAALIVLVPNLRGTTWLQLLHPILVLEALADLAFGIAWFVKGETILKDKPQPPLADVSVNQQ